MEAQRPALDARDLLARYHAARAALSALDEQARAFRLAGEQAAARLAVKDEFERVTQAILEQAQERTLGVYNHLLGHLLREVIAPSKDARTEDRAADLRIVVERGVPGLYVGVRRLPDGVSHSVLRNSGGAVTDVICTGLQLLALYRNGGTLRPFLVLDEPDKWIEPWRIGRFYKVFLDLVSQMRLQAVVVSHHPLQTILPDGIPEDGTVRVLRLRRPLPADKAADDALLLRDMVSRREADTVVFDEAPGAPQPDPQADVRRIGLFDFLSHAHTEFFLGRGLTFITGSNDVGKSALTEAVLCATDAQGTDDMIADGAPQARVEIETQDGTLVWRRLRSGSPKEVYAWTPDPKTRRTGLAAQNIEEAGSRGNVPAWVSDVLRIGRCNGVQVQALRQKSRIFLLEEPPMQRAQVLSLGQESALIFDVIEAHKRQVRDDSALVRAMESNLERIRQQRERLRERGLDDARLQASFEAAEAAQRNWEQTQQQAQRALQCVRAAEQYAALTARLDALRRAEGHSAACATQTQDALAERRARLPARSKARRSARASCVCVAHAALWPSARRRASSRSVSTAYCSAARTHCNARCACCCVCSQARCAA
jgi:hypothetical protein